MAEIPVMSNNFEHEPLDLTRPGQIRVFHVLPGTGTIRCSMKQVHLYSDRIACSYAWGDPEPSQVILINERPFHIRQNLHDFLLQLRKDGELKSLWVDALCIDQSNTSERNHQVQQMGSIYRGARKVVSWLGQGEPSAARFMQFARIVSEEVREIRAARLGTTKSTDSRVIFYLSVHRHRWSTDWFIDFYLSFTTFCGLEYFTRTWIVQEVFLAPEAHTAYYGDVNIAWVDLKHVVLTAIERWGNWLAQSPVIPFIKTSVYHPHTADSSSVFGLIAKFATTKCSDPRDHVFALHSLWDSGTFPIRIDYNLSSFALLFKLASWLLTPAIQPLSSFITLIDALELQPEDFANGVEQFGADEYIPITLSVASSREVDMRGLSEYRETRLMAGESKFSKRTTAHAFHFCICEHCIRLHDLPETTVFREYLLRSRDHDPTKRRRMSEAIYLLQIIGPQTYWGLVEGDFGDSDPFLLITPACLNRASELPRVEEREGRLVVGLSLRCLCELFNHLRPDEIKDENGETFGREGYWGIDRNKHEYIYDDDASFKPFLVMGTTLWRRKEWRNRLRKQGKEAAILAAIRLWEEHKLWTS